MALNPIEVEEVRGELVEALNLWQPVVVFEEAADPAMAALWGVGPYGRQLKLDIVIGCWSPRRSEGWLEVSLPMTLPDGGPGTLLAPRGRWFLIEAGWSVTGQSFAPREPVEVWVALDNVAARQTLRRTPVVVDPQESRQQEVG